MMKKLALAALLCTAIQPLVQATTVTESPVTQENLLSGRNMQIVKRVHKHYGLTGNAPVGSNGTYRILDSSKVIWEGRAGEAFSLDYILSKQLYLVSPPSGNAAWQNLSWRQGTRKIYKAIKKHLILNFRHELNEQQDAGPPLRELLYSTANARNKYKTINIPKGEYHFYPEGALEMSYYISNHDQQDYQKVGIPLVGQNNLIINGNGSTFIFHGKMQPVLIMDSKQVILNDITIRHDAPYYNEGKIVENKGGTTTLEFPEQFRWLVNKGRYYLNGDGSPKEPNAVLAFCEDGKMVPTGRPGDIAWTSRCEQISPNRVKFFDDAAKHGLSVGNILVLRHYGRPHPAMVLYRADDTTLNNVTFQDSQGMALIAQRCRDISIQGGGCICAPGRVYTASADATHFSNCAGTISVKNALYEGMMDDAINVHSTCLSIERVITPREIIARYMHPQAVGFEVFEPGEHVQFIHGKTLENHKNIGKTQKVEKLNERQLRITLEAPLPDGIGVGDAIENADWYPAVNFIGCTVRHNRARGTLFTTPKPVLVKDCRFIASHGSAILLAGDAQGWYESGRCLDVKIINNVFEHNLTARYQFTEGIISIYPMVKEPDRQTERYHRNITIKNNIFRTHRVPLIYAISADNLSFTDNTIIYDDKYPSMHGGTPYILKHCDKTKLQKL